MSFSALSLVRYVVGDKWTDRLAVHADMDHAERQRGDTKRSRVHQAHLNKQTVLGPGWTEALSLGHGYLKQKDMFPSKRMEIITKWNVSFFSC